MVTIGKVVDAVRARSGDDNQAACWYGEMLRQYLFVADQHGNDIGYTSFVVNPELVEVGDGWLREQIVGLVLRDYRVVDDDADDAEGRMGFVGRLNVYVNDHFFVAWLWDGEGELTVGELDHGAIVRAANNSDCKKAYNWTWIR